MDINYFHFSLSPVQGFIAQARRTRDFWAGSFLLSWLSAVAMQAVIAQDKTCNKIIFPKADEDFLLWLTTGKGNISAPEHGSVPNRFKAEVTRDFQPELVVKAVNDAWKALANKVYAADLPNAPQKTADIWNRQVKAYWEISWVITPDPNDSSALDVRKNWRSHSPPDEPGVKCMMMDGWQELSGVDRSSDKDSAQSSNPSNPEQTLLTKFWTKVREDGQKGIKTDVRDNEHLCAIAFIKRRFVRYFHELDQPMTGWTLHGWKLQASRPSVAYMAAVHWLEEVLKTAKDTDGQLVKQLLKEFHQLANELTGGDYDEWNSGIQCIEAIVKGDSSLKKCSAFDGNVFFESSLANANIFDDIDKAQAVQKQLNKLLDAVNEVLKFHKQPELKDPSPFYAVLMMDGDSLGKQMSDPDKQDAISTGLGTFTDKVPDVVRNHSGFLIYAGGDDVLAVLPLEDALPCALAIRQQYEAEFARLNGDLAEEIRVKTSISAAVVFAPIKMPLTKVLKQAHNLLDNVAKDEYGRDSLAVSVWKPGGRVLQWARPWEHAIEDDDKGKKRLIIKRLADDFADDDNQEGQLSNKFLYKIRERFELLNPPPDKPDTFALSKDEAIDLMATEYFSSGLCEPYPGVDKMQHAKTVVKPLLEQCRPIYRDEQKPDQPDDWRMDDKVFVDAALLVRFLAQKGVAYE